MLSAGVHTVICLCAAIAALRCYLYMSNGTLQLVSTNVAIIDQEWLPNDTIKSFMVWGGLMVLSVSAWQRTCG